MYTENKRGKAAAGTDSANYFISLLLSMRSEITEINERTRRIETEQKKEADNG